MFRIDAYMMVLCFVAICAAVVYAQFDEEFGDMIGWISRTYHYPNGVQMMCAAYECNDAAWAPGIGRDGESAGLRITAGGQDFAPGDFVSAAALAAKGWSFDGENAEQGRFWLRRALPGYGWMQAEFERGALARVFVRADAPVTLAVEGQTIRLPLDRREMKRTFPAPLQVVRRNAVNGALPD
jgi:hypothetical protein